MVGIINRRIVVLYERTHSQPCARPDPLRSPRKSARSKRRASEREGADLLIVWYLAIKFDSPDRRKKQPLISSGLRKLQPPEWPRLSLASCIGSSGNDCKGGFQQVARRIGESRSGHRSDGEPLGGVARSTSRDDKKISGSRAA